MGASEVGGRLWASHADRLELALFQLLCCERLSAARPAPDSYRVAGSLSSKQFLTAYFIHHLPKWYMQNIENNNVYASRLWHTAVFAA